ncbi:MAG: hypothetical protein M1286_02865 [Candidatus Marsarchaeota archaeon]|nr:hypothetical protein [Candidatus Marsarchaeota archaeon]
MRGEGGWTEDGKRLKVYASATLLLVGVALLSFILVPQGASQGACGRLVIQSSRYACYTSLALAQTNASLCGYEPSTFADSCYLQVAEKGNSTDTCGSIGNLSLRGECVTSTAEASGNYSACTGAQEPYASRCFTGVAVRLENASICGLATNSTAALECGSIISIRKAVSTGVGSFCANVTNSHDRNVTAYIIGNASSSQQAPSLESGSALSILAFMPNVTYTARDYCYISLATSNANPNLCLNVSAGEAATLCDEQAGRLVHNTTSNFTTLLNACEASGTYSSECVNYVTLRQAVETRNATLCASLTAGLDNQCYALLASAYNDTSYCGSISNASIEQACISGS